MAPPSPRTRLPRAPALRLSTGQSLFLFSKMNDLYRNLLGLLRDYYLGRVHKAVAIETLSSSDSAEKMEASVFIKTFPSMADYRSFMSQRLLREAAELKEEIERLKHLRDVRAPVMGAA